MFECVLCSYSILLLSTSASAGCDGEGDMGGEGVGGEGVGGEGVGGSEGVDSEGASDTDS